MTAAMTDADLPLQCLYRWSAERPQQLFLSQPHDGGLVRNWTWAQAADEVRRVAAYLRRQGWEPGTRVAILSRNCAWWVMADLAIWMAGYVTVPIYPSLNPHSVELILEHSGARACFIGATDDPAGVACVISPDISRVYFPTAGVETCPSWDDVVAGSAPMADSPVRPASELSTIVYTSGTTGKPKGVMHSFGAFALNARLLVTLLGFHGGQRFFSYLPLAHILERAGVESTALVLGASIYFTEGLDTFLRDLRRARPTILLSVPRLLSKFQQGVYQKIAPEKLRRLLQIPVVRWPVKRRILGQLGLRDVRQVACGSAPLSPGLMSWYRTLGVDLSEGYGMTETLVTHLPSRARVRPGFVGAPIGDCIECRVGPSDELQIRSPMNMLGYYKDELSTADAFTADGFFKTGDMVAMAEDGQVRLIGRIKEQFKTSKGKYVFPAPIEGKLAAHPAVEACCLMGAGLPCPAAVLVLTEKARAECEDPLRRNALEESLQTVLAAANEELEAFERISCMLIVDDRWTIENGAVTPTMKIKRPVLESRYMPLLETCAAGRQGIVWQSALAQQSSQKAV